MSTIILDETHGRKRFECRESIPPRNPLKSAVAKPKPVRAFFIDGQQVDEETFASSYKSAKDRLSLLMNRYDQITDAHDWNSLEHLHPASIEYKAICNSLDLAGLEAIEAELTPEEQQSVTQAKAQFDFSGTHLDEKAGRFIQLAGALGWMFSEHLSKEIASGLSRIHNHGSR